MKYRILKRRDKTIQEYIPFGVTYQIREGFILDVPGWRSPAILKANSLEALTKNHFPGKKEEYK